MKERLLIIIINSLTEVPVQQHKLYGLLKEDLMSQVLTYLKLQLTEPEKFMLRRKMLIS
jgi:hypothetical protein